MVGVDQHFAGGHVDHVGGDVGAFADRCGRLPPARSWPSEFLRKALVVILRPCGTTVSPLLVVMACDSFSADQAVGDLPEQLLVLDGDVADVVERAQNLGVGLETQRAQEHGAVEFALAVDTDVQQVLVVVFEFDPASAVRNDLAEEIALRRNALEEHAGRAVQLRNDHALGAVDDEGAVVGHQRNFAEEDFLLLDVADGLVAGFGVLGVNRQADGDLERSGVGHAALFALGHVVFQLQAHRVAALVAEGDDVLVERAAVVAQHVARDGTDRS